MGYSSSSSQRSSWNLYAAALIFLYAFFQGLQWPLLPRFLDIYYHLGVMKGFADAGGYVNIAFWEYAPSGRPHLYPPFLHILMLVFYKVGVAPIDVGRLVDCLSFPLLLFAFHYLMRKQFSPRAAFLGLVVFSSSYSVFLASVTLSAFNLAFALGLLALAQANNKNPLACASWLVICFYTHVLAAWLFVLSMFIFALLDRSKRRTVLMAVTFSGFLASPLLWHQWASRSYFSFVPVHENRRWAWDLTLLAMALLGLWSRRIGKNRQDLCLGVSLCLGFLPIVLTHQTRYFGGHGLAGFSALAAVGTEVLLRSFETKKKAFGAVLAGALLCLWFLFLAPVFEWNVKNGRGELVWADRSLTRSLFSKQDDNLHSNSFSIYFPEQYAEMVKLIKENSAVDDILWTDFSYTAGVLGVLSDRATSCGMLAEIRPFEKKEALDDSHILLWFKNRNAKAEPAMWASVHKRSLQVVKELDMAFVLVNPDVHSKRIIPQPLIKIPWLFILAGVPFIGLFLSRKGPKKT